MIQPIRTHCRFAADKFLFLTPTSLIILHYVHGKLSECVKSLESFFGFLTEDDISG